MGWYILAQVLTILISIVRIGRMSEQEFITGHLLSPID
jgi:hypothetical protein